MPSTHLCVVGCLRCCCLGGQLVDAPLHLGVSHQLLLPEFGKVDDGAEVAAQPRAVGLVDVLQVRGGACRGWGVWTEGGGGAGAQCVAKAAPACGMLLLGAVQVVRLYQQNLLVTQYVLSCWTGTWFWASLPSAPKQGHGAAVLAGCCCAP